VPLTRHKYSIEMCIELDVRQTTVPVSGTRLRRWRFSDRHTPERLEGDHTDPQLHLMLIEYSTTALHYCTHKLEAQEYVLSQVSSGFNR
jgi:hypothetical protein